MAESSAPEGALPEIDGRDLDADALRAGIIGHGALLVRGLIDADRARRLAEGIDRAADAARAWEAGEPTPETKPWYRPFNPHHDNSLAGGRSFVRGGDGIWTADSPRMLFTIIDMLKQVGFIDVVNAYLGEEAAISVKKSTLRIVPPDSGTNWHQDGAFLGEGIRTCNLWLALSDCGVDAPSLDVVPRRIDHVVETGTRGAIFDWSVGPDVVDDYTGPTGVTSTGLRAG